MINIRKAIVKPLHIQPDVWNALCDWWDSAKFRAMSDKNKDNRKRKMLLHTTGAKSYVIFRQELEKKERRMLTLVEFFDATHEKKNQKGTFWTPEAANQFNALSEYNALLYNAQILNLSEYNALLYNRILG
ncbi:hypothetical protein POM88_047411 [Heracleum sosnowskyi]|uniref:Uncharacterized protein n=1 Tax=Heracleum sosnowskyi TaxID=360622 RepID=A0AAD8GS01_9APIA|nr:hypothetical protein POM88_047411 [Heracleum sosnowskyi]